MAEYRSGGAADFLVDKVLAAGVRAVSPFIDPCAAARAACVFAPR